MPSWTECEPLPLLHWRWEGRLLRPFLTQSVLVSRCLLMQSLLEVERKNCYGCLTMRGCVQSLQHHSCRDISS